MYSNTSQLSHFREFIYIQDRFYTIYLLQPVLLDNHKMPNQTNSKRISISLNPELYSIVSDLAELQNKPMSRVVVELMEEMQPILASMASAMAEVKKSNDPTAVLKQFGQNAIMDANELLGGFLRRSKNYD